MSDENKVSYRKIRNDVHCRLNNKEAAVFLALVFCSDYKTGESHVTHKTLGEKTGFPESSLKRYLKRLAKEEFIYPHSYFSGKTPHITRTIPAERCLSPVFLVSGCNLPTLETVIRLQFLFSCTSALPVSAHQGKTKAEVLSRDYWLTSASNAIKSVLSFTALNLASLSSRFFRFSNALKAFSSPTEIQWQLKPSMK